MDEGADSHLCFTLGALKGIHFIDSLYARAPTALTELTAIVKGIGTGLLSSDVLCG